MIKVRILTQIILSLIAFSSFSQTYESDFVNLIQKELGGEREVSVTSGYVDLLTDEYAIEVEFANKWKQAIGQALWYGLQTNKRPAIVLIKKSLRDQKYVNQLFSALNYGALDHKLKVWVWPDDLKKSQITEPGPMGTSDIPENNEEYWLTSSSMKRHNSGCRYYQHSKGKSCTKKEGIACKVCGG